MKLWRYEGRTIVLDMVQEVGIADQWDSGTIEVYVKYLGDKDRTVIQRFYWTDARTRAYNLTMTDPEFLKEMNEGKWLNHAIEYRSERWLKDRGLFDQIAAESAAEESEANLAAEALRDQIEFLLKEVDIQYVTVQGLSS
jgi:hypothetical protein